MGYEVKAVEEDPVQRSARIEQMEEEMAQRFADSLNDLLVTSGMTNRQFSYLTDLDQSQISKYRNGKMLPSVAKAAVIAEALGVSLDFMLRGERRERDEGPVRSERRRLDPSALARRPSHRRGAQGTSADG